MKVRGEWADWLKLAGRLWQLKYPFAATEKFLTMHKTLTHAAGGLPNEIIFTSKPVSVQEQEFKAQ